MEYESFVRRLTRLSSLELANLAEGIRSRRNRDGDDESWWRATAALDRSLRRRHLTMRGRRAAQAARAAVRVAARRAGLDPEGPEATTASRAGAEVARSLIAEDPAAQPCYFFEAWKPLLGDAAAWAGCSSATGLDRQPEMALPPGPPRHLGPVSPPGTS